MKRLWGNKMNRDTVSRILYNLTKLTYLLSTICVQTVCRPSLEPDTFMFVWNVLFLFSGYKTDCMGRLTKTLSVSTCGL